MSKRALPADQVRFRPALWQVLPQVALLVLWVSLYPTAPHEFRVPLPFLLVYGAMTVLGVTALYWSALILTPTHAIVRGFRVQRIPWAEVRGVSTQSFLGSDRIVLWTTGGRSIKPRAPYRSLGMSKEAFERDYHRIGQWWQAHHTPPDTEGGG